MITFLVIVIGVVFLFGLIQWARSGAVLWDIHELTKRKQSPSPDTAETSERYEKARKEDVQKSIQRMEVTMDGLLKSSYLLVCVVALCVWIFVGFFFVMDMLEFEWTDRFYLSTHRVTGSPAVRSSAGPVRGTPIRGDARSDRLREMGAGFRGR